MNKKLILTVTVWLVSLLMATSLVYVLATGTISNPTFEAGTQIETASYVVWREGSTCYSKNGSTGEISSSSNASNILQNCVDSLTGGGRILVKAPFSVAVAFAITNDAITIEGEGYDSNNPATSGTVFLGDNSGGSIITAESTTGLIVKNIRFGIGGGINYGNRGINVSDSEFVIVDNCWFLGLNLSAFYGYYLRQALITKSYFGGCGETTIDGGSGNYSAVRLTGVGGSLCSDVVIENSFFINNKYVDIQSSNFVDNSLFVDKNYFHGYTSGGVRFPSFANIYALSSIRVTTNYLSVIGYHSGIYISANYAWVSDNMISNNGDYNQYGIYVNGTASSPFRTKIFQNEITTVGLGIFLNEEGYAEVSDNTIEFCNDTGIVAYAVANAIFSNNILLNNGQQHPANGSYQDCGIYLYNAPNNIIEGNRFIDYDGAAGHQRWGVYESGTSDYNIISNNNARSNVIGGFYLAGANSHVTSSWNGTTWIA